MNKISFIIPTFNRANVLCRAVDSIIRQTSEEWELIIVDDGSTDHTKQEINDYLKSEKIKYVYQEHSGVSTARNKGIEIANGDYVIFLDSDDKFHPNLVEDLIEVGYENYDLLFWYTRKIKKKGTEVWKPVKLEKIYNSMVAIFLAGSACYRKDILEQAGGFDPMLAFGENYELGIRIAQNHTLVTTILPEIYLDYYSNKDSRPNSEPVQKLRSLRYHLKKHMSLYEKDAFSYSRILYQMGYLNEKLGKKKDALDCYQMASSVSKFYIKPLLKRFIYKIKNPKS